ncbi:MAG TPA: tRNA uridine-5-carboxymethylaminomethyl(34) synthesis enzyme MnmG, partial [Candidatus Marinimicrobia bacterium]|nr:tRNA uridine-5-carboxymethylaminomethyl(34) synthesis enzyme MnmG [Candidatus Neomarinimicrobiota bacterium]
SAIDSFKELKISPEELNLNSTDKLARRNLNQLIKQTIFKDSDLSMFQSKYFPNYSLEELRQAYTDTLYEGYIIRQQKQAEKLQRFENKPIPKNVDYQSIVSLSNEGREKLIRLKPDTLGQASRIRGISPADLQILLIYLN